MYSETPNPINLIAPEDLGKGSGIKLDVCDTEHDMYWKMAMEVLEIVEENNKIGKKTVMIVPYGPIGYIILHYCYTHLLQDLQIWCIQAAMPA